MSSIYKNGTLFGTTEAGNITTTVGNNSLNLETVTQDLLGDLATIESNPSTRVYEPGQFLTLDGKLYKVTADIAIGDTLSTTTNLERTNAGTEFNSINQNLEATNLELDNTIVDIQRNGTSLTVTKADNSTDTVDLDIVQASTGGTFLDSVHFSRNTGVPGTSQKSYIVIGNGKTEEQEGHSSGCINIYGTGAYKAQLQAQNITADRAIYLPDAAGTLALNNTVTTSSNGLMVASDKVRFNNWFLNHAETLSSRDFNSYTTEGIYKMWDTNYTNGPFEEAAHAYYGILIVVNNGSGGYIQLYYGNTNAGSFRRGYTNSQWYDWQRLDAPYVAVKGDAESSYRTGNVNLTAVNVGAVPTSGGTFSGHITVNRQDGTTSTLGSSYIILGNDTSQGTAKNSRGIIRLFGNDSYRVDIWPSDDLSANRNIRLPDAAGKILVDSKIVVTRGQVIGTDSSSISSGSNFRKGSLSLNPGTYIIIVTASWQKNSNGFRAIGLASNTTDFASGLGNGILLPTISDDTLREQLVCVVNPGVTSTYYINVKQSSGSNLTCSCRLTYLGIAD